MTTAFTECMTLSLAGAKLQVVPAGTTSAASAFESELYGLGSGYHSVSYNCAELSHPRAC